MRGPVRPRLGLPRLLAAGLVLAGVAGCGGGGGGSGTPTATPGTPSSGAGRGRALSASLGCRSCHSLDGSSGVGPTWKGLAGSRVSLTGGKSVSADDRYLLTAIRDPDKQIVAGYQAGVMSGTIPRGSVSRADAKALVAYIRSLG